MWRHEKTSLAMFDYLIEENNLLPVFEKHGFDDKDLTFIKELINGPLEENSNEYTGREHDKYFLYEIVANKISSIDVDKWDYFKRDNQALQLGLTFDPDRFIKMSHLVRHEGKLRLTIEDKEDYNIQKIFEDRGRLHKQGYQHRVIKKIDRMILDVLLAADDHLEICHDKEGRPVKLGIRVAYAR